jgi:hypothetical protein
MCLESKGCTPPPLFELDILLVNRWNKHWSLERKHIDYTERDTNK